MNWFDILKNQIASTKGKQFQLDFTQPMVEEEEEPCKEKLIKLYEKFKNNWDSISKPLVEKLKTSKVRRDRDRFIYSKLSSVPEEVCCEVIRLWNELRYGTTEVLVGDYFIDLTKQTTSSLSAIEDYTVDILTYITITGKGSNEEFYNVEFTITTDEKTKESDEFIDIVEEWIEREMSL